jgi:hypothetical protein
MSTRERDRIRRLLQQSLTPIGDNHEPARELWPELRDRIGQAPQQAPSRTAIPWFDWVLAGGVAIVAIAFPASIPVLLYYL